jgi:hypothetical protein
LIAGYGCAIQTDEYGLRNKAIQGVVEEEMPDKEGLRKVQSGVLVSEGEELPALIDPPQMH